MECPKCGMELDDKATVCPNCKKVLKIVCPKCKTINKTNTCKRCGYVILTKCHKCGKISLTENGKCKKCGFDLEQSVILNEANSDQFACLIITFPAMGEIKQILGTTKLFNKFKDNLDKLKEENGRVLQMEALEALKLLAKEKRQFDLLLLDPPYAKKEIYQRAIDFALENDMLTKDAKVIVEYEGELPLNTSSFPSRRDYTYGYTKVIYLRKE